MNNRESTPESPALYPSREAMRQLREYVTQTYGYGTHVGKVTPGQGDGVFDVELYQRSQESDETDVPAGSLHVYEDGDGQVRIVSGPSKADALAAANENVASLPPLRAVALTDIPALIQAKIEDAMKEKP